MIYASGQDLKSIKNRVYARYDTNKAEKIILALDKCNIPYFARFNGAEIFLTYDGGYNESVSEIITKAMSGDYEIITQKSYDLLPEIAEILSVSISFLKSRPDEVQEVICKRYVDLWFCDTSTIKRELTKILIMDEVN